MEIIAEYWPFSVGHQKLILNISGFFIIGLIILNLFSALRQDLPLRKVISVIYTETSNFNKIEKAMRVLLITLLITWFIVLFIDIQVNGMQLINREFLK